MHAWTISLILSVLILAMTLRWRMRQIRQRGEPCPSWTAGMVGRPGLAIAAAMERQVSDGTAAELMETIPKCIPCCDPGHYAKLPDSDDIELAPDIDPEEYLKY
jgi:hypothetical protein